MTTVFWNVDTQYDFMRETYNANGETVNGKLPVPGEHIEDNLATLTGIAEDYDIPVVNTADWHNEATEEISTDPDYQSTFPPHCMQDTKGASYVPATEPRKDALYVDWQDDAVDTDTLAAHDGDVIIYKDEFNVFDGNPHTDEIVDALDPDRAVVYGVATDVCVDQAVNGLLDRNIDVYAVNDAMAGLGNEAALEDVKQDWTDRGAHLVSTDHINVVYNGSRE